MPAVSTSFAGPVIYRTGLGGTERQFKWFDRTGKEIAKVGEPMTIASSALALSPDGRFVAMNRTQNGNSDIYLLEVASGKLVRLTDDPLIDVFPVWSPDSATVYFNSNRLGPFELYEKPITGLVPEKLVMPTRATRPLRDASRDGRFLLYKTSMDIAAVQLDGNPRGEFPVIQTAGIEDWPQFSPDAKWVAFQSDESGRVEVYIQQFPSGRRWLVSKGGGAHPRWHPSGKELLYIAPDGQLLALPVEVAGNGQEIKMGDAKALFAPPIVRNVADGAYGQQYMLSNDGERFLIATVEEVRAPIKVIRNWKP
jgi:Tol biopolymer transport system component